MIRVADTAGASRFARGAVATPHRRASEVGREVLLDGGNAVDAAVAANLVLAVITPYHCGLGGDMLAIVWDGAATGVLSAGGAPGGATPEAIRAAVADGHGDPGTALPGTDGMPARGALPVTVPGAAAGWFHLLERWGSRSFDELARAAITLARDGFVPSGHAGAHLDAGRRHLAGQPGWNETYGTMTAGRPFVQRDLAASLELLGRQGPTAMYGGVLGERVAEVLAAHGSTMRPEDLAAHEVEEVVPLVARYRGLDVLELPPPTQGVTAATALGVLEAFDEAPRRDELFTHLQVEAVRAALSDRREHLADPRWMRSDPAALLDPDRLGRIADAIDPQRAGGWPLGRPAPGGTAYLCAADDDGLLVSLIQSNFMGFGSGVVVPGTGIGLHNRGAHFGLHPEDVDVIAPGKRPLHTLIPALGLSGGAPRLVFGTMGGDGQAQTHVQLLGHLLDRGMDVQQAIAEPRWVVDVGDGAVCVEADLDPEVVAGLRRRGHRLRDLTARSHVAGHAHALEVLPGGGYAGGTDPRAEGAVLGH
jgi:gamma-glutamyltranspeptidase / glutathione hydrolase